MAEPTKDDVDALVGPATPHFAYQLRARLEELVNELREAGTEPVLVRGNVASERTAEQVRELGPLDALVHNAATGVIRPALETEDKHWDWTLNANARALLALTRAAAPTMPA